MRIALLLALVGCMSSEPVRDGQARIQLDSSDRGTAMYRVVSGSNDSACAHGEHFTPTTGAEVRFGPSGGDLVSLADQSGGTYTASTPTVYAAAYRFSVDGEVFELVSPPDFSARVESMSPSRAVIELSNADTPSDVVIHMPDGRSTARTLVGSPATIDADFSARGEYQIELLRTVVSTSGLVEIQRTATVTMR